MFVIVQQGFTGFVEERGKRVGERGGKIFGGILDIGQAVEQDLDICDVAGRVIADFRMVKRGVDQNDQIDQEK